MPKRECPFDEHLSPQLKVHVGQKQFSNGVNKDQEMKRVYEKTLSLLKKGSRELGDKPPVILATDVTVKQIIPIEKNSEHSKQNKTSALKQMILDSKMKLQATDKDIDLLDDETGCEACKTTAVLAYTRCFYCNNFRCMDCLDECTKCQENFCQKCSLIDYENGEHTECLACYR